MIARLLPSKNQSVNYDDFLKQLAIAGFRGDIAHSYGQRMVPATDNSIYQRLPQAVVFPLDTEDVAILATLAADAAHRPVVLTPRGGETGTNGQSLARGAVVSNSFVGGMTANIDITDIVSMRNKSWAMSPGWKQTLM